MEEGSFWDDNILPQFLSLFFLRSLATKLSWRPYCSHQTKTENRWLVFVAAASALILSTGLAVLLGAAAERWMGDLPLKLIAGLGFLAIGVWMIADHIYAA